MSYNTKDRILENLNEIEEKIAYHFSYHKKLLIQAFTRKSFAQENEGFEDNEVLEFYGDQIVNAVMTKRLFDTYSTVPESYSDGFFYSKENQNELTKIRARYVSKNALAHCIEILGLDEYLLLGNSDEKNEVWKNEKVRCDLFEAIIGAIAVDSNWNFKELEKSCKAMWGMLDFSENFVDTLYNACEKLNISEPKISVFENYGNQPFKCQIRLCFQNYWNYETIEGYGISKTNAKMEAAKNALNFLNKFQIEQIAGNVTRENAVQTLNTLYLKKLISKPEYQFPPETDNDGNQIWRCECFIDDYKNKDGYDKAGIGIEYKKAEAKQAAAFDMIYFILGKENPYQNDDYEDDYYDDDDY